MAFRTIKMFLLIAGSLVFASPSFAQSDKRPWDRPVSPKPGPTPPTTAQTKTDGEKYRIGMSMDEAQALLKSPAKIATFPLPENDTFSRAELEQYRNYEIKVEEDGVVLEFNTQKRLIRIRRKNGS